MKKIVFLFITQVFFFLNYSTLAENVKVEVHSLDDIIAFIEKDEKMQKSKESKKSVKSMDNDSRATVCTKSYHSNLRKGADVNFPVHYEILIKDYPLKVIKYIDTWYAIEDFEGEVAWISEINVKKKCGAIVKSYGLIPMYFRPEVQSKVLILLERGSIIKEIECISPEWCRVKINKQTGWVEKKHLWGNI